MKSSLIPLIPKNLKTKVACFGEVLWDVFPDERRVGGAPLNACLRLKALGLSTTIISSVGADRLGDELLGFVLSRGVNTNCIAVNPTKPTSEVRVTLSPKGSASYEIVEDTAWDNILLSPELLAEVSAADVFIYGSLVGRNEVSYRTLQSLLDVANFKVFDVNLRAPHYTMNMLVDLMKQADFIKLNDDELFEIAKALGSRYNSLEQNLEFIAEFTNTPHLCVTKGSHGALLKLGHQYAYNSGYAIKVADTVGAGDNFLGALIYQLCVSGDAQYAINFACAVGALVAQSPGATPDLSLAEIEHFMNPVW